MDLDGLSRLIESTDSLRGLLILFLVGLFALVWRFGNKILDLLKTNSADTAHVRQAIVTNHGSRNLGDAVDRITDRLMRMQDSQDNTDALQRSLARDLERHITECREFHRPGTFIVKEETTDEPR